MNLQKMYFSYKNFCVVPVGLNIDTIGSGMNWPWTALDGGIGAAASIGDFHLKPIKG